MIRRCTDADVAAMGRIINRAARAYRGVIPSECWHEPYMPRAELLAEIAAGVDFWGREERGDLVAVMGLQEVGDAMLIRHAYVLPEHQGRGIAGELLTTLVAQTTGQVLVGTWAAANWAVRFYSRHGFRLVSMADKDRLLDAYWKVPRRQKESSVVLVRPPATRLLPKVPGAASSWMHP